MSDFPVRLPHWTQEPSMKKLTLLTILILSLGLAFTGCGDSGDTTGDGADAGQTDPLNVDVSVDPGADTAAADDAGEGEGSHSELACHIEEEEEEEVALGDNCDDPSCPCGVVVNTVTGFVQDATGAPVTGAKAQICTRSARDYSSVCLSPVDVAANGAFSVSVPSDNNCLYEGVLRALAPASSYSTAYCTYDMADLEVTGGVIDLSAAPAVLYPTTAANNLPAECVGGAGCMADQDEYVTMNFDDGLSIDINPSWLFNGAVGLKDFSATYIEGTDHLCNGDQIAGAPGVWAFSPEGDGFEIRFPARIPDKLGLADGTLVNVYIQGGVGQTIGEGEDKKECEEGTWRHFACATVEGGVITLDEANGVPAIGWLAYAPAE